MKAIIKRRPITNQPWYEGLELVDRPEPVINESNQVKIKVLAAGICGTDLSIYKGTDALKNSMANIASPELIIGHEFAGQIFDLGSEARKIIAGKLLTGNFVNQEIKEFLAGKSAEELAQSKDLISFLQKYFYVSAEMHIVCWDCYQCRLGEPHVCQHTFIKGLHQDGAFAEYVVVPVKNLLLFPKEEIPLEVIAFMDAIGNAVHTIQAAEVDQKNVLVLGAGIQGLIAAAVAKRMGAKRIFLTDASGFNGLTPEKLNQTKFDLARRLGVDECFDVGYPEGRARLDDAIARVTDHTGVDLACEMSGSYSALEDALRNIRMGGTIAMLGLPSGTQAINFSKDVIFRGVTIKGIIGRRLFSTWELMQKLLINGLSQVILDNGVITHDLPLENFEQGFLALKRGEAVKVILRP